MAIMRLEPHPVSASWSASGTISLELSPKPYTITRMMLILRTSITTTTATNLNDYWDRIISRLNLTGAGKTFFDFTNMRVPYHLSRFGGFGPPRPTVVADSATTLVQHFAYCIHFGIAPLRYNPISQMIEDNPWDLTGGIPPVGSGNLTLGGTWGAAAAMGTNTTVASASMDVYLFGVQPEGAGEALVAYLPRAYPTWSMRTPTPTATSSALATQDNFPAGGFLHSALVMLTNGTGAPRDDSVLNSFEIYNNLESRSILKFGGQSGAVADVKAAEIISQFMARQNFVPLSDNANTAMTAVTSVNGVPQVTNWPSSGLYYLPLHQFAVKGHPLYGVDLRNVATGDLQMRYGVSDATGVTLDVLYRKYELNMEHPGNLPVVARAA